MITEIIGYASGGLITIALLPQVLKIHYPLCHETHLFDPNINYHSYYCHLLFLLKIFTTYE